MSRSPTAPRRPIFVLELLQPIADIARLHLQWLVADATGEAPGIEQELRRLTTDVLSGIEESAHGIDAGGPVGRTARQLRDVIGVLDGKAVSAWQRGEIEGLVTAGEQVRRAVDAALLPWVGLDRRKWKRRRWPSGVESHMFISQEEAADAHQLSIVAKERLHDWRDTIEAAERRVEFFPASHRDQAKLLLRQAKVAGDILWASEVFAASPAVRTHDELLQWCDAVQLMLQYSGQDATTASVWVSDNCLTHAETIKLAWRLLWDETGLSGKDPAWLPELQGLHVVPYTPAPLFEPIQLNDLLDRVWVCVRRVGGPRLLAPKPVRSVRGMLREVDRVVRWCQKQKCYGAPPDGGVIPQQKTVPVKPSEQPTVDLRNWAVGIIGEGKAMLFQTYRGQYRERRGIKISKKRQTKLLRQFAEGDGTLTWDNALRDDPSSPNTKDRTAQRKFKTTIESEISKMRNAIRIGIGASLGVPSGQAKKELPDPLPLLTPASWEAKIKIGYATPGNDGQYIFKTHGQAQQDLHSSSPTIPNE